MKNNFYLLFATILFFVACENEAKQPTKILSVPKESPKEINRTITTKIVEKKVETPSPTPKDINYTFNFKNIEKSSAKLTVSNDVYYFTNIKQPIVMVNLFSTWCPPCRGEIPHLSNLQKKFKKNLFILSALVYDDITDNQLSKLISSEKMFFFLSSNQKENLKFFKFISSKLALEKKPTLPLMVLFINGKYFTHYEGSMPEEMIESDIKQLLKKIEK